MSAEMAKLSTELVAMMLEVVARDGVEPSGFAPETPCLGGELLQDSLDVLEFLVAIDRTYGIAIRDEAVGQTVLRDLGTITRYVADHRTR